jgi:hypothetical protein
MKKLLLILSVFAVFAACKDDDVANLSVDTNEITFDAKGTPQTINVTTDQSVWRVDTDADWISTNLAPEGNLTISATSNPRKTARASQIYVSANGAYQRIIVSQAGSLHEVGEPYPADNPVGIIYMTADGGEHGFVLSLEEMYCGWGPHTVATPGSGSLVDGKENTQAIIEAHSGEATFATDYPAFDWVNTLNGGDPNGPWYIPSYYQLIQMQHYLTGSDYIIPNPAPLPIAMTSQIYFTHADKKFRDGLNATIANLGGTPVTYTAGIYWSSTEVSASNADIFIFNDGQAMTANGFTSQPKAKQSVPIPGYPFLPVPLRMRAVMEF